MAIWKKRSKRKVSGGVYRMSHKKKSKDTGESPVYAKHGDKDRSRERRVRGANKVVGLTVASHANVASKGGVKKQKILNVVENNASRNFVRQGIITRGAIVKVDAGLARVTSRPTRDGVVNAVLLK